MVHKLYILGLVMVLFFPSVGRCAAIDWKSYPEGMVQARQENKKILLHFKSDRCPYCVKMDRVTFSDSRVIEFLNKEFVCIQVNGDKEGKLTQAFNVRGYPDTRFLNEKQEPVFGFVGFQGPEAVMVFLEYVRTESYKTMDPMQFYNSRQKQKTN
ncbi:MAG: thioredoxin family protein [Pseudomonadota bacterium]